MANVSKQVKDLEIKHRKRKAWHKVVGALACVVVFCTTYMLILPAITMTEKSNPTADVKTAEVWEATFDDVELSGNYAADILQIAQTQLGYEESEKNFVWRAGEDDQGNPGDETSGEDPDDGIMLIDEQSIAVGTDEQSTETEQATVDETQSAEQTTEPEIQEVEGTVEPEQPTVDNEPATDNTVESETGEPSDEPEVSDGDAEPSEAYSTLLGSLNELYAAVKGYTGDANDLVSLYEDAYNTAADLADQAASLYENGELAENEYNALVSLASEIENYIETTVGGLNLVKKGYTRYGAWYGDAYGDWCAMFVSFCLNYAEVPTDVFPQDASCGNWIETLSSTRYNLYKPADGGYMPSPGDLVFFDWDGDGSADHVGIVAGLSAEASNKLSEKERETILADSIDSLIAMEENAGITLITIEGNSSDKVQTVAYDLNDSTIMGYGNVPGYTCEGLENAMTEMLERVQTYGGKADGDELEALCSAAYEKVGYADNAAVALYENGVVTDDQLETLEGVMGEIVEVLTGYGFDLYGVDTMESQSVTLSFSGSNNTYTASTSFSMEIGDTYTVSFGSTNSASSVTNWSVSSNTDSSVADASVSTSGSTRRITGTALAAGTTTITVAGTRAQSNRTYTYTATINITVAEPAQDSTTMTFTTGTQSITRTYYMTVGNTTTVTISGVGTSLWTIGDTDSSVATTAISQNRNNQTSTLTITAVSVGTCTITGMTTYNNTQYNFTIYVIVAERDVSSDFIDTRYYHLDIEVDADFTIYYYDASSGSLTSYKPDNVTVTSVTGVIYNTRSLSWAGASSITWTESDWATSGYSFTDYNSADTYDGNTVASVIPVFGTVSSDQGGTRYEIPSARVQNSNGGNNNNQDPMAGQGEGGYAFYDGDTVVLTVTIQYVWNDTTYTRTFEVTQLVTDDSNTCSSKNSAGTMHGYDIYVESEDITEIAATQIQKVDQYGNPVKGATFAVYATDQDGNYYYKLDQTGANGQTIYADLSNATYTVDETTGMISITSGAQYYTASTSNGTTTYSTYNGQITSATITPTLVGTTGADGFFTFVYPDTEDYQGKGLVGMAMTMNDLKTVYGEYFIMREINVPEGYHALEGEMHMHIIGVDTTLVLTCENEYESGVSTNTVALVLSTGTLYKADPTGNYAATADGTTWGEQEGNTIEYWTKGTSGGITLNGSLFAVVLKKGNNTNDATIDNWYPVYGNDEVGYTVVEYGTGTEFSSQLEAVIYAAQQQIKLDGSSDGVVFSITGSGASVGVTLKNLPGDITQYYTYIQKQHASDTDESNDSISAIRSEAEYFVAYYYYNGNTFGSNTTGLDSSNTCRVVSRDGVIENYGGFTIQWGSEIDVTNYENRIYFEKIGEGDSIDSADSYVNGAVFALYSVGTDDSGNLYYIASDGTHIYLEADTDRDNKGTATVNNTSGTYEISYSNPVIDGNGNVTTAGYGVITVTVGNNTYTINPVDVQATHESCSIATTIYGGTGHFLNVDSGTYVMREIYAPEHYSLNTTETQVVVADDGIYVNAGSKTDGVSVGKGPGYLTTSLSGSASEGVIDDTLSYIFGALQINEDASMSDVASGNVTWSYTSGSNGITSGGTVDALSNAMVSYWEYTTNGSAVYNYAVNDNQSTRTAGEGESGVSTAEGSGTQRLFTTVGWSRLYIGQDYIYGLAQLTDENGKLTIDTYTDLTGYGDISGLFSRSTFVVVEDPTQVDIEIDKTGATGTEQLTGAEFYLYYEVNGTDGTTTRYYYSDTEETTTATWVAGTSSTDSDGNVTWTVPDTATKLTTSSTETGEDETTVYSTIHVYGLSSTIGTYYLEEVTAPTGYTLLDGPVTIKVAGTTVSIGYGGTTYTYNSGTTSGWKVSKKTTTSDDGDTVTDEYTSVITVPNGNGERLPNTGGMGTGLLYGLAILLITGCFGGLFLASERHKKTAKN